MNERVWSVDGMVLKVETRSTMTGRYPVSIWFTTDLTLTGPGINPGLRSDRPRTNRLSHIDIQAISVCLIIIILTPDRLPQVVPLLKSLRKAPGSSVGMVCWTRPCPIFLRPLQSTERQLKHSTLYRSILIAGEPLGCFDYIAWAPSEPRNRQPDEDCVVLDRNQQWGVTRCSAKMPYVCELWPGGDQRADMATNLTRCNALQNTGRPQVEQSQRGVDYYCQHTGDYNPLKCNILLQ